MSGLFQRYKVTTALVGTLALGVLIQDVAVAEEPLEVSGFLGVITENGDGAANFSFAEDAITIRKGRWRFDGSVDLVDRNPENLGGDIDARFNRLKLTYMHNDTYGSCGLQTPFNNRASGVEFVNGIPGTFLSRSLTVQGGVTGCEVGQNLNVTEQTSVSWFVSAGTKIKGFSKFGNEDSAGFNAPILGAGTKISHTLSNGTQVSARYNLTHFASGAANENLQDHYASATVSREFGSVSALFLTEITVGRSCNRVSNDCAVNESVVAFGQISDSLPLVESFGWRAATGVIHKNGDTDVSAEAFITFNEGDWSAQLGGGFRSNSDAVVNFALKRSF